MSNQNPEYAAVVRHGVASGAVRQKWVNRGVFFVTHLVLYLVTMAAVWGLALNDPQLRAVLFDSGSGAAGIVILPTILWTMAILCHVALLYTEWGVSEKLLHEYMFLREAGADMLRRGLLEDGTHDSTSPPALAPGAYDYGEFVPADEHL